jgi:hypothetical protein
VCVCVGKCGEDEESAACLLKNGKVWVNDEGPSHELAALLW